MGATLLKVPELELSEAEAKKLNDAATDVMRYYTEVDIPPVVQAWLNLGMVCGTVYGPRFMAVKIRKSRNVTPRIQPTPVVPINQPKQPGPPGRPTAVPADQALREWSQWNSQAAAINQSE
jgi:hypothetical protein